LKIAERSVEASLAAISSDRAWMCHGSINTPIALDITTDGVSLGQGVIIGHYWINKGRSPAISCMCSSRLVYIPRNSQFDGEFKLSEWPKDGHAPVGPDGDIGSPNITIAGEDFHKVFRCENDVVLYSAIKYREIYSPLVDRFSEYCFRLSFNGIKFDITSVGQNCSMT